MKIIVAAVMMLSMAFVAICQIQRNMSRKDLVDEKMKLSPVIMFSGILVLLSDVLVSGGSLSLYMLVMDMFPSVAAIWLAASSFSEIKMTRWAVRAALAISFVLFSFQCVRIMGKSGLLSDGDSVCVVSAFAALLVVTFIHLLVRRMSDVKTIMKNGVVWAVVCLIVDVVYLCFMLAVVAVLQLGCPMAGLILSGGIAVAAGVRIMTDSKFLIWRKQERLIVESMKITSLPSASDASHIEDVYKELYDRVVTYFESEKPYLNSELTINAIVKKLYSNKLYLSRSISQFTGRNFCQFVNYYRVKHSVDSFRANPELKVHELATMCGFNTVVSFNMAFRLFMGENPSEWCRKERSRLIKTEK